MDWVGLGFDVRSPISNSSTWKVGDLGFENFIELVDKSAKIKEIISFDLNLSPRPNSIKGNCKGEVDIIYGAYCSQEKAYKKSGNTDYPSRTIYWEVEKNSFIRASNQKWFDFSPADKPALPDGWTCIGIDIINDQGVSEYWDIGEDFWSIEPSLINNVNEYGLLNDEALLEKLLNNLPLDPANIWVMPVRVWVPK